MKYVQNYAYIMDDENVYAVKGLRSAIREIIPQRELPYYCRMVLLPFRNQIVYDGLIDPLNIESSKNIKQTLKTEFNHLKIFYQIT